MHSLDVLYSRLNGAQRAVLELVSARRTSKQVEFERLQHKNYQYWVTCALVPAWLLHQGISSHLPSPGRAAATSITKLQMQAISEKATKTGRAVEIPAFKEANRA